MVLFRNLKIGWLKSSKLAPLRGTASQQVSVKFQLSRRRYSSPDSAALATSFGSAQDRLRSRALFKANRLKVPAFPSHE
jgi:hypothetical protein